MPTLANLRRQQPTTSNSNPNPNPNPNTDSPNQTTTNKPPTTSSRRRTTVVQLLTRALSPVFTGFSRRCQQLPAQSSNRHNFNQKQTTHQHLITKTQTKLNEVTKNKVKTQIKTQMQTTNNIIHQKTLELDDYSVINDTNNNDTLKTNKHKHKHKAKHKSTCTAINVRQANVGKLTSECVATWPLAKPLGTPRSFGDCESLQQTKPLLHLATFGSFAQHCHPKPQAQNDYMTSSFQVDTSKIQRKLFGAPFEWPPTGWLTNALEKRRELNKKRQSLDANYSVSLNLAPLNDHQTNSNTKHQLQIAHALLDLNYATTVRLFIQKSSLNWNFNSFTFDSICCGSSLTELLLYLFDFYDLYNAFELNIISVLRCFKLLELGYHSTNPYHNAIHATDVTQAMHCFMQEYPIKQHLTPLDTLGSILAAVCHDLDHPGVQQSFLIATNNPLVSLYKHTSVLENHHWRFAESIFKESTIFQHLHPNTQSQLFLNIKTLILATDMARQNEYLKQFKLMTHRWQNNIDQCLQSSNNRSLVLQMALKCADLGNPCRPWLLSRCWSEQICEEFYRQGDFEQRISLILTPICQRNENNSSNALIQANFFTFIVMPLIELWHLFLLSPLSSLLLQNLNANYAKWQHVAAKVSKRAKRRHSFSALSK